MIKEGIIEHQEERTIEIIKIGVHTVYI
jgi:hypothetical protein